MLLWCATPDSVIRLKDTQLHLEEQRVFNIYFNEQPHNDILKYMMYKLEMTRNNGLFAQVNSSLLLILLRLLCTQMYIFLISIIYFIYR